ncbi:MAG: helix-turn-helix domain-containing protein [Anaerovoracaceae bacterium]
MKIKDLKTKELENILINVKTEKEIQEYVSKYTRGNYRNFSEYFNVYLAEHELKMSEVIKKSNISRNYVYNIVNGDRNPGRDKIIALCIGAGMNYSEINRALKIAGEGVLYPKNERDARIAAAVNNGIDSVVNLNIILAGEHLRILD